MKSSDVLNRLHASLDDDFAPSGQRGIEPANGGWSVPDDYFSSLPNRVMATVGACRDKEAAAPKTVSLRSRVYAAVASAAAALLVLLAVGFYFQSEQEKINDQVDAIMASEYEVDALFEIVGTHNIEEILADIDTYTE